MTTRRARRFAALLAIALLPAGGCSEQGSIEREAGRVRAVAPAPAQQPSDAKLAYSHDLTIGLDARAVEPHFAAARDRCLKDAALRCVLIQSSIRAGSGPLARPDATLRVRLPHESVATYVAFLTAPRSGETQRDVVLREQATRAEDLTRSVADTARRLTQFVDYRDRLAALAQKPDTRVEDLVKIASEQSQVQSQIEDLEGKKRGLDERIDTELLAVTFRSDEARADVFAPVADVWDRSGRILGESTASALRFTVASLPWLPVVAIGLLILRAMWRRRRSGAKG